jgi:hypothetical protein
VSNSSSSAVLASLNYCTVVATIVPVDGFAWPRSSFRSASAI